MKVKSMTKYILNIVFILVTLFFVKSIYAATVSCSFMSETTISKSGEWLKTEADFMKLYEMFGDGLELKLDNSLLGNLDSKEPFLAGEVDRGRVFLMGGEYGVEGKLIGSEGNELTIYDGMCTVGFG